MTPEHFFFRRPILLPLLALVLFYVILLGTPWLAGHDTFHYVLHLHYFLSHLFSEAEVPLWAPFVDWGRNLHAWNINYYSPTTWFVALIFFPFSKTFGLESLNGATLSYVTFFFEELLLLWGTYRLARDYFTSPVVLLFVVLSVIGSSFWLSQRFLAFEVYYALPLALSYIREGCRAGVLKPVSIGGFILLLTGALGLGWYPAVIPSLVGVGAFFLYRWEFQTPFRTLIRSFGKSDRMLVLVSTLLLVAAGLILIRAGKPIAFAHGRTENNLATYSAYLKWGAEVTPLVFEEIVNGLQRTIDTGVYGGFLIIPLVLLSLFSGLDRRETSLFALAAMLVLFSLGPHTPVAPLSFFVPGMRLFRHVFVGLVVSKIFFIFLAGLRLEKIMQSPSDRKMLWLLFGLVSTFALFNIWRACTIYTDFGRGTVVVILTLLYVLLFASLAYRRWEWKKASCFAFLTLVALDVYAFRSTWSHNYLMNPPSRAHWEMFSLRTLSYQEERMDNFFDSEGFRKMVPYYYGEARLSRAIFDECNHEGKACVTPSIQAVLYNSLEMFADIDACSSWFQPYTALEHTALLYQRFPMPNKFRAVSFPLFTYANLEHRYFTDGFKKVIGCETPKLAVLHKLEVLDTEKAVIDTLTANDYVFGGLLTSKSAWDLYQRELKELGKEPLPSLISSAQAASEPREHNETVSAVSSEPKVVAFAPNTVEIEVEQPQEGAWLYYADAWHSDWQAWIDGEPVPILRANSTFKAIQLPAGKSKVRFSISSWSIQFLYAMLALISIGFTVWFLKELSRELWNPRKLTAPRS